ncbi:MAG: transglycosylase SLT domain-containing protein [Thermodesulfobacteriota bacterium]|jgi:membrane-bound lytic murein transglycosylase F|nr:MAG: transglycosylase SLT domain-containing protein [Thermodesulfobacteriota bacterium]
MNNTKYDLLFKQRDKDLGHDWQLFKAMGVEESHLDPNAVSPCGAIGIMQIMPATAKDLGIVNPERLKDPITNIRIGTAYFAIQFDRLRELTDQETRYKAALAAYNGGRGYIKKAIGLYRVRTHKAAIPPTWDEIAQYLADPTCLVRGKRPDYKQMINHVRKVWATYQKLIGEKT